MEQHSYKCYQLRLPHRRLNQQVKTHPHQMEYQICDSILARNAGIHTNQHY
ncbi:Uncharacterised protein [Vibrio cholerae]|nr:Uncharacterised protein [Vibrio cholerae]